MELMVFEFKLFKAYQIGQKNNKSGKSILQDSKMTKNYPIEISHLIRVKNGPKIWENTFGSYEVPCTNN